MEFHFKISSLYLKMNRFAPHFLILLLACFFLESRAQETVGFSKPELSLEETSIIISFDILNSSPSDRFMIGIEVSDPNGKRIIPKTIEGDIGAEVSGGSNKIIKWDLESDEISMNLNLTIELIGKKIVEEESVVDGKQITRFGAMARSAVFPGWGLSLVNPGKPHWIKGVAAYGSLGGALVLNQRSQVNYDNYLDSSSETERNDYYDKSLRQEQLSSVFAYTAVGIWAVDLIWTLMGTKSLSKQRMSMQQKGFTVSPGYETIGNTPLLSLKYSF